MNEETINKELCEMLYERSCTFSDFLYGVVVCWKIYIKTYPEDILKQIRNAMNENDSILDLRSRHCYLTDYGFAAMCLEATKSLSHPVFEVLYREHVNKIDMFSSSKTVEKSEKKKNGKWRFWK